MNAELLVPAAVVLAGFAVWTARLFALYRQRDRSNSGQAGILPVSIIVPARNEAHNLPALLDSLASLEPAPNEIIVVDDHSTDGTGDIARSYGVSVIVPPPLPSGWNGKPWACRTGAAAASSDYLLFTDADTVHAPDSLGRAMARSKATQAALLSVVPTHIASAAWEKLQGAFQLLLLVATRAGGSEDSAARRRSSADGNPDGKSPRAHERRFSIGQYLLFRRDAYDQIGGHEPVCQRIAEDLAFARLVESAGMRFELLFRPGLMRVRMYPEGLGAFVRGWRRNFREGMTAAGPIGVLEMVAVIGWLLGVPLFGAQAAISGNSVGVVVWALVYVCTAAEVSRRQRAQGEFPVWSGLLYPVFVALFATVSGLALVDRLRRVPVVWRGRTAIPGGESSQ